MVSGWNDFGRMRKRTMRTYKGWSIEPKNHRGMWTATNYSKGWGMLQADTLLGLKQFITHTIEKRA
jgi:hypothetical protein